MTTVLLVAAGAGVGAPLRHLTDVRLRDRVGDRWPWGTLLVNLVGSFVLAVVVAGASARAQLLVGTGFCGALTTFSTFALEVAAVATGGRRRAATAYALGSVVAGLACAALGWFLGTALPVPSLVAATLGGAGA